MNQFKNPEKKIAYIGLFIIALSVFFIFFPSIISMDMMNGGYAIIFFSFFVGIVGVTIAVIYFKRASILEKIVSGNQLLAYWRYSDEEWREHLDKEFEIEKDYKKQLFIIVAIISLVIGLAFLILAKEGGLFVFLILLGLVALISFFAFVLPRLNYNKNKKAVGEVYISPLGVYIGGVLHNWTTIGAKLESVSLKNDNNLMIEIIYSYATRMGKEDYTLRIPVPKGEETKAQEIVNHFQSL